MSANSIIPEVCLACGATALTRRVESQSFDYVEGKTTTVLTADVPMYHCRSCEFDFMGEDGSQSRDLAVRRHLGVLSPSSICEVRGAWGLTRAAFAELTGIGIASLARWETGQLIQNLSADRLLRLCQFAENIERLRAICAGGVPAVHSPMRPAAVSVRHKETQFRALSPDETSLLRNAEVTFNLRAVPLVRKAA
jgi:putative zinc finger/helix-turn-helix YgiT family protein